LQKKGEKKGEEAAEREDVPRAAEKSKASTNARASRPQFHAIESARTKLKTNRFPAPCWHALHLFAARATWATERKKKKKTGREPHIYVHKTSATEHSTQKRIWCDRFTQTKAQELSVYRMILRGSLLSRGEQIVFPRPLLPSPDLRSHLIEIR